MKSASVRIRLGLRQQSRGCASTSSSSVAVNSEEKIPTATATTPPDATSQWHPKGRANLQPLSQRQTSGRAEEGVLWGSANAVSRRSQAQKEEVTNSSPSNGEAVANAKRLNSLLVGDVSGASGLVPMGAGSQWTGGVVGSIHTINQLSPRKNERNLSAAIPVITSFQDVTGESGASQRWKKRLWNQQAIDLTNHKAHSASYTGAADLGIHLGDLEESNLLLGRSVSDPSGKIVATPGKMTSGSMTVKSEGAQWDARQRADALLLWQLQVAASPKAPGDTGIVSKATPGGVASSKKWGVDFRQAPLLSGTSSLAQRQDFFLHQLYTKSAVLFDAAVVGENASVKLSQFDKCTLGHFATYLRLFRHVNLSLDLEARPNPPTSSEEASLAPMSPTTQPRDRHARWLVDLYGNHAFRRALLAVEGELETLQDNTSSSSKRLVHTVSTHIADIVVSLAVCGTPTTQAILVEERPYAPIISRLIQGAGETLSQQVIEHIVDVDMMNPSFTLTSASTSTRTVLDEVRAHTIKAFTPPPPQQ